MIERKAQGEEIVIDAPVEQPQKVPDLMAALEASIAAAKSPGGRDSSEKPAGAGKSKTRAKAASGDGKAANGGAKKRSSSGSRRKAAKK